MIKENQIIQFAIIVGFFIVTYPSCFCNRFLSVENSMSLDITLKKTIL